MHPKPLPINRRLAAFLWIHLLTSPVWAHGWRPVVVDKSATRWFADLAEHQDLPGGVVEIWVKKVYKPDRMAIVFQMHRMSPSAYDLELWRLYPDRKIGLVQAVRYDADDIVLESYFFLKTQEAVMVSFPPDSAMEALWETVLREHGKSCPAEHTKLDSRRQVVFEGTDNQQ